MKVQAEQKLSNSMDSMDRGYSWMVLLAAFTGQLLISGVVPNMGVYLVEWQQHFDVGASDLSVVATEIICGTHFTCAIAGALCRRYGCRVVMMMGGFVASLCLFSASFSTQVWHLYVIFFIAGIAFSLAYMPTVVVIGFYFKRRLSFANGVVYAGIGAGLLIMAPVVERLCSVFGWQGAMLIHAAITANLVVCGAVFRPSKLELQTMRDNRANPVQSGRNVYVDVSNDVEETQGYHQGRVSLWRKILRDIDHLFAISRIKKCRLVIVFAITTIFTLCGYVTTLVYIFPKLVFDLNVPKMTASLVISTFGICSVLSRLFHGFLLDYKLISVTNLYIVSVLLCGVLPMTSPLVTSIAGQFILSVTFGVGAGVMNSMTSMITRNHSPFDIASNTIGFVLSMSGIGIIMGTQMMGKLYDVTGSYDIPFYINGAFLWAAAFVYGFIVKYSCWKHVEKPTTNKAEENDSKDMENDIEMSGLNRYQPVSTNLHENTI